MFSFYSECQLKFVPKNHIFYDFKEHPDNFYVILEGQVEEITEF